MVPRASTNAARSTLLWLLPFVAALVAGCGSSSTTATGPSPLKCQVSLTLPAGAVGAAGGAGLLSVSTTAECAWTAKADVGWITSLSPASGQGSGQIQFVVSANPNPATRQGQVTLNEASVRVNQAGSPCSFELSPASQTIAAAGGTGTVGVTTLTGCAWSASSDSPWLTVTSGSSGSASGSVGFAVAPNGGVARVGTLTIGGQPFMVSQAAPGNAQCSYAIQPTSLSTGVGGGSASISVIAGPGCSWGAVSNASWIAVVGGVTGSGNGTVLIDVQPNTGSNRAGTLTIAGQTFTVMQAGTCLTSIAPSNVSVGFAGGIGLTVAVTAGPGCTWTAASSDPWLIITAGASGSGNGTVTFSVAANPTTGTRIGTLTIAGQLFTVTQAALLAPAPPPPSPPPTPPPSCSASLGATSHSLTLLGGSGSVAVTIPAGCAWTATTPDTWITITAGASGTGNGTVSFAAGLNLGNTRQGTITIAGVAFVVTQAGLLGGSTP